MDYYALADGWFALGDYDREINGIAKKLNTDTYTIYDLIYAKLEPLEARVKSEYQKTEEYKTNAEHEEILEAYRCKKESFAETYGVKPDIYDYCYNVFGEVINQKYLDEIIATEQQRQQAYSSYYKQFHSNYSYSSGSYDYSNICDLISPIYAEDEKIILKKFYRSLSMQFHPDKNSDIDTTKEMQLLNKLKDDWKI